MAGEKSKILIFGATGYLGKYMVKGSVAAGHETYVYVRPLNPNSKSSKIELHKEFKAMGVTIFEGDLDEHEKIVSVLKQVEIVISVLGIPTIMQQLKIIKAIKEAGNIKRFFPSDFGNEADRVSALPPFEHLLEHKRIIRRTIEEAEIPYTIVSANSFAAYFINYLLHPHEENGQVIVYGSGEAKAVLNFEEDTAAYTMLAATDPRTLNRLVVYRPSENIVSQLELITRWEKKTGKTLKRVHVPKEELIKQSYDLPYPDNVSVSILYSIFVNGDQTNFELTVDDLEASELYPDYKYTSLDKLLDKFMVDPPKPHRVEFY